MHLILYTSATTENSLNLIDAVARITDNVLIVHETADLRRVLKTPLVAFKVVVFHAASRAEFESLVAMRQTLRFCQLILVYPGQTTDYAARGLSLFPRYTAQESTTYQDLIDFIEGMRWSDRFRAGSEVPAYRSI